MAVINITKDNFQQEVVAASQTVLVDFWATWCGPCQMMGPILDELATKYNHSPKNILDDASITFN